MSCSISFWLSLDYKRECLTHFEVPFSPSLPGRGDYRSATFLYSNSVPRRQPSLLPILFRLFFIFCLPLSFSISLLCLAAAAAKTRQGPGFFCSQAEGQERENQRQSRHEDSASARHAKAPPKSLSRRTLTHRLVSHKPSTPHYGC